MNLIAGEGQNSSHSTPTPTPPSISPFTHLVSVPVPKSGSHQVFWPNVFPPTSISSEKSAGLGISNPCTHLPCSTPPYLPHGGGQTLLCRVVREPLWVPRTDSPEVQGVAWSGIFLQLPPGPKETHTLSETARIFMQTLFQSESPSVLSDSRPTRQNRRRNPGGFVIHPQNGRPSHSPAGHEPGQQGPEQAWGEGQGESKAPRPDGQSNTCLQDPINRMLLILKPGL